MKTITKLKIHVQQLLGLEIYEKKDIDLRTVSLGSRGANWSICPDYIHDGDIVYSFGIGTDISFDLEFIEKFAVDVFAYDPTPRSIEWLSRQKTPESFHAKMLGLSDHDGTISLIPPPRDDYVSYRVPSSDSKENQETFECRKLKTLMNDNGHNVISVCKMDIEGEEIAVLKNMVEEGIVVGQLLVEFHQRFPSVGLKKVKQTIEMLRRQGDYLVFYVNDTFQEISFIHKSILKNN